MLCHHVQLAVSFGFFFGGLAQFCAGEAALALLHGGTEGANLTAWQHRGAGLVPGLGLR